LYTVEVRRIDARCRVRLREIGGYHKLVTVDVRRRPLRMRARVSHAVGATAELRRRLPTKIQQAAARGPK
jgi:hypothetical protein